MQRSPKWKPTDKGDRRVQQCHTWLTEASLRRWIAERCDYLAFAEGHCHGQVEIQEAVFAYIIPYPRRL